MRAKDLAYICEPMECCHQCLTPARPKSQLLLVLALVLLLSGCGKKECRGEYTYRDDYGVLKKSNEVLVNNQCMTEAGVLTRWEASSESRLKSGIKCQPQSLTKTLVSSNNFYSYRDGKVYLDLNGSTGDFRRLTVAEGKNGEQVYTRLQGCFYRRTDAVNGDQLLLDTDQAASSQYLDPVEIFTFTSTATTLEAVRFDDSFDWTYAFCPILDTPDSFCALLRNGNEMFFPVLTAPQQASLLSEAILMRRQFNFASYSKASFESKWNSPPGTEKVREDYKYAVQTIVDTPRYIDQAWIAFVKGKSSLMPDITSNRIPPVCYHGRRTVTLADGSTSEIYGEICYADGVYTFTQ